MGAKFVTFVDKSNISTKCIKDNLAKCSFENKSEVINKSFSEITRQLIKRNNKYNLIFIDPPYDYFDEKSLNGIIRTALKLLENQGIIVCEHPMKEEIKLDVANYRVKKYKDKYITFCEKL